MDKIKVTLNTLAVQIELFVTGCLSIWAIVNILMLPKRWGFITLQMTHTSSFRFTKSSLSLRKFYLSVDKIVISILLKSSLYLILNQKLIVTSLPLTLFKLFLHLNNLFSLF